MHSIEVDRIEALPEPERLLAEPAAARFLLTALLAEPAALLHAEYLGTEAEVTWYLQRRSGGLDEPVAVLPAGLFRSVAGRLAVLSGLDHTRGGHGNVVLVLDGVRREAQISLSNCRATGYWIRVETRPE